MRKRNGCDPQPRMTDAAGLSLYVGLGRSRAMEFAYGAHAVKRFGRRILIDLRAVDAALDELPEVEREPGAV